MSKTKLINDLFIGKVTDILGFDKTLKLLKESNDSFKDYEVEPFYGVEVFINDQFGNKLKNGDKIQIDITNKVKHIGVIKYHNGSFCLEHNDGFNKTVLSALSAYASYCLITKID